MLSVSRSLMSKWKNRPDWPVRRQGPWSAGDVRIVNAWQLGLRTDRSGKGKNPQLGPPPPDPGPSKETGDTLAEQLQKAAAREAVARAAKMEAQALQEEMKVRKMAEQLMPVEDFEALIQRYSKFLVATMNEMEAGLPGELDGDQQKNRLVLEAAFDAKREELTVLREIPEDETEEQG